MKINYSNLRNLLVLLLISSGFSLSVHAQNAWINEIHYDDANSSGDINEIVEIVIENASSYTLSLFKVELYNGASTVRAPYDTKTLDDFTIGSTDGDFSFYYYTYPSNTVQNGAPDGLALSYNNTVISGQFLSYEGTFTAVGGLATGLTSIDIGVLETNSTFVGYSLQLSGAGSQYSDFTWQGPATATAGALNNGQSFTTVTVSNPSNFNATTMSTAQIDLSWALNGDSDPVLIAYNTEDLFGTPSGDYSVGNTIGGNGTVIYIGTGTSFNHTGLTSATQYYYKAWSRNTMGIYSSGVTDNATTYKEEPSNYPTAVLASGNGMNMTLDWTDATGATIPDGYLVMINTLNSFTDPVDGTTVSNDLIAEDGSGVVNIAAGLESCTFYHLEANTVYYFKIYPYTNSGAQINYKTDGTAPTSNDATQTIINTLDFESNTFGEWTAYSVASNKNWILSTTGTGAFGTVRYGYMSGYNGDVLSDDWLISPSLNLDVYTNDNLFFYIAYQYGTEINELTVKYSTNYVSGDPNGATWTNLSFSKPGSENSWVGSGLINLASISGTNVHIAFHYVSATLGTGARTWRVDEIEISGDGVANPANFDAATASQSQINLSWDKNMNGNNVMLAFNTSNQFGVPMGTYPNGAMLLGGGTVLYTGQDESFSHTGRTTGTTYYYKAWSYDGSVYSNGATDHATTQFAEPGEHPTGLTAIANGSTTITVSWTDAEEAAHYLVKGSAAGYNDIVPPVDLLAENDALLVKNVDAGIATHQFTGLTPNTAYYFKIYPYNGSGESSNYKTDGTVPEATATTEMLDFDLIITEVSDPQDNTDARFVEIMNTGETSIDFSTVTVYLSRQANGEGWGDVLLTGTLAAGATRVIAYNGTSYTSAYSLTADQTSGNITGSGNDGYFLYYGGNHSTGYKFDAYGVINEDGTGMPWEYTDKKAVRKRNVTSPNPFWTASEWEISGSVALVKDMTPAFHNGLVEWQGSTSTNWNTKGNNWNSPNGYIPDASCIVTIPVKTFQPIITEVSACHQVDIQTGASLSIQSTGSLKIVGP